MGFHTGQRENLYQSVQKPSLILHQKINKTATPQNGFIIIIDEIQDKTQVFFWERGGDIY